MYGRYAMRASQACMNLFHHHACLPKDGAKKIDLDEEKNRSSLVAFILARIEETDLASIGNEEKGRVINDMENSVILHPKNGLFPVCCCVPKGHAAHQYRCPQMSALPLKIDIINDNQKRLLKFDVTIVPKIK